MGALRALLFAVFGGFIGAAPAAPVVEGPHDVLSDGAKQTQKSERPSAEASERPASGIAGAPPHAGGASTPVAFPAAPDAPPPASFAEEKALLGRAVPPPLSDIRAGLLDLPPPAR